MRLLLADLDNLEYFVRLYVAERGSSGNGDDTLMRSLLLSEFVLWARKKVRDESTDSRRGKCRTSPHNWR